MKRSFVFLFCLFLLGWFTFPSGVKAAGCIIGPLNGTCRIGALPPNHTTLCTADEVNSDDFINTPGYSDYFTKGICAGDCCVTKDQLLCSGLAKAAKLPDTYTCSKPCVGKTLLSTISMFGEVCGGDTVCCNTPSGTPSPTPSPKPSTGSSVALVNPLGAGTTLFTILNRLISFFLGMVGALALAVFVYAGILWMTAGSSDRVKQAKDAMKYAIIGLAMIAFSYAITTTFLSAFFKAPVQNTPTPAQEAPELGA